MSKRALIVDDSRSARVILSRMLESYGLEVDSSESAEQALEFLRQARPDVIFMDHLMPGMDGFQAIQAIKGNPDTAMIPVVMYTSQEGELYVSQARALGAVGVLPKTVKQVDVSRVLYQLRLLPERRGSTAPMPAAANEPTATVQVESTRVSVGEIETAIRNAVTPMLKEHSSEMRRFVLASLEAFARRINTEARPPAAPAPSPAPEPTVVEEAPPAEPSSRWPLAAAIAAVALLPTAILAVLYTQTLKDSRAMMQSNASLASIVEEQQSQLASLQQAVNAQPTLEPSASLAASAPQVESETVPYGEIPLSGPRIDRLREMIDQLKADDFRGKIKVSTYVGEFCLTGSGIEGYSVADEDMPATRCSIVSNPFEDSLTAAQRQSLAFANLVSAVRQDTADAITVEVHHEGRRPVVPYPDVEQRPRLTAGEWNRIAAQNNRVEFAAQPAGS
jgi:CheY-like chemotaxis protein